MERSLTFGSDASRALDLVRALATLGDRTTRSIYYDLAADWSSYLRAVGIAGLISANDPAEPRQAAREFRKLRDETYVDPIAQSLMIYCNPDDAEAVRAFRLSGHSKCRPAWTAT